MKETERKKVTKAFTEYWKDRGDKKSDNQFIGKHILETLVRIQNEGRCR